MYVIFLCVCGIAYLSNKEKIMDIVIYIFPLETG
jgi:hypothetical protein